MCTEPETTVSTYGTPTTQRQSRNVIDKVDANHNRLREQNRKLIRYLEEARRQRDVALSKLEEARATSEQLQTHLNSKKKMIQAWNNKIKRSALDTPDDEYWHYASEEKPAIQDDPYEKLQWSLHKLLGKFATVKMKSQKMRVLQVQKTYHALIRHKKVLGWENWDKERAKLPDLLDKLEIIERVRDPPMDMVFLDPSLYPQINSLEEELEKNMEVAGEAIDRLYNQKRSEEIKVEASKNAMGAKIVAHELNACLVQHMDLLYGIDEQKIVENGLLLDKTEDAVPIDLKELKQRYSLEFEELPRRGCSEDKTKEEAGGHSTRVVWWHMKRQKAAYKLARCIALWEHVFGKYYVGGQVSLDITPVFQQQEKSVVLDKIEMGEDSRDRVAEQGVTPGGEMKVSERFLNYWDQNDTFQEEIQIGRSEQRGSLKKGPN